MSDFTSSNKDKAKMLDALNSIISSYAEKKRKNKMFLKAGYLRKSRSDPYKSNVTIDITKVDMEKQFPSVGGLINQPDDMGRTHLHIACQRGSSKLVSLLLKRGADPNQKDLRGNTPLHLVATTSRSSVVSVLLKAGADPFSKNNDGSTPLSLAQLYLQSIKYNRLGESDTCKLKEEIHSIINMLIAVLQNKNADKKIENLSELCSQLSLSSTREQIKNTVESILTNSLNATSI